MISLTLRVSLLLFISLESWLLINGFHATYIYFFFAVVQMIPASYYDELPLVLPKTALLQGSTGGCFWKVAMFKRRDEVYFGQGWSKFVEDNRLSDGDVMTFVYDGSRSFTVSIFGGSRGCAEVRAVAQVISVDDDDDDDDDNEDTNTSSERDMSQTVPNARNQGPKTLSLFRFFSSLKSHFV